MIPKRFFGQKTRSVAMNEYILNKNEIYLGMIKKRAIITHACQMERPHKQMVERENRVQLSF